MDRDEFYLAQLALHLGNGLDLPAARDMATIATGLRFGDVDDLRAPPGDDQRTKP